MVPSSTIPDLSGTIINQHFKLIHRLGSGAFGVVYKALDTRLPEELDSSYRAVKVVLKAGRSASDIAHIRNEIKFHSMFSNHPNVVTLYDAFDDDTYFYLTLDLVTGGDLFDQICTLDSYRNDDGLLREAFLGILDAVQALHDQNVAHRDLKPENVLTSEDGSEVFLADFGIATDKEREEVGTGTTLFMAPECFRKMNKTRRYEPLAADIWALGIILFNMIVNSNPWEESTFKDERYFEFFKDPKIIGQYGLISKGAARIVRRMLRHDPFERPDIRKVREMILEVDTFFRPSRGEDEPIVVEDDGMEIVFEDAPEHKHRTIDDSEMFDTDDESTQFEYSEYEDDELAPPSEDSEEVVTPDETDCSKELTPLSMVRDWHWRKGSSASMLISQYKTKHRIGMD